LFKPGGPRPAPGRSQEAGGRVPALEFQCGGAKWLLVPTQPSTARTRPAAQARVLHRHAQLFPHTAGRDHGCGAIFRAEAAFDVCGDFGLGRSAARAAQPTEATLTWPIP
jgi:hypothetical protein